MQNQRKHYCSHCGEKIDEETRFCHECGNQIFYASQNTPSKKKNNLWKWLLVIILSVTAILLLLRTENFNTLSENDSRAIELSKQWVKENIQQITAQSTGPNNISDTYLAQMLIKHFLSWDYEVINHSGDLISNVDAKANVNFKIPLVDIAFEGFIKIPLIVNIGTSEVHQNTDEIADFDIQLK